MTPFDSHPSGPSWPASPSITDSTVRKVHTAVSHLRSRLSDPTGTLEPGELVEPLLQLWAAANEVHPWVALPVQHFLTGLTADRPVPTAELRTLVEDVSLLLLEVRSLSTRDHAVAGGAAH